MKGRRSSSTLFVVSCVVAIATAAEATPSVGMVAPELKLSDAWNRTTMLSSFRGKPILVVYEEKRATKQNEVFKAELSRLARGDKYRQSVALVAVADVSDYDYWPVRGFVKDAIQEESNKQGTTIYCDWNGAFRSALKLNRGASNVVLFDRAGKVIFAESGTLSAERRAEVLARLRKEVEP